MKNEYKINGNVVEIKTTRDKVILVDLKFLPKLLGLNNYWSVLSYKGKHHTSEYGRTKVHNGYYWETILLHNFLYGKKSNTILDHKDGNGLNNLEDNIRRTSICGNYHNKRTKTDHLKGVYRNGNGWSSAISRNRKLIYLGQFATPEEAHAAYLAKAKEFYPELYSDKQIEEQHMKEEEPDSEEIFGTGSDSDNDKD